MVKIGSIYHLRLILNVPHHLTSGWYRTGFTGAETVGRLEPKAGENRGCEVSKDDRQPNPVTMASGAGCFNGEEMNKIEEQLGKKQGKEDWIVYRATGYNPETKELHIYIEEIGDDRWNRYLNVGQTYILKRHENSSTEGSDPMELWELPTNQKKWVKDEHIAIPEYDLVFPQILLYFWHNDNKLSIEWDW